MRIKTLIIVYKIIGSIPDTYTLTYRITRPSWTVTPPSSLVYTLGSGESADFSFNVAAPNGASEGESAFLYITATSTLNNNLSTVAEDEAQIRIQPGADFTPSFDDEDAIFDLPGTVITLTHFLTNTGSFTDDFVLTLRRDPGNLTDNGWGKLLPTVPPSSITITVAAGPYTYTLAPQERIPIFVRVEIPSTAEAGLEETFYIDAESQADQGPGVPNFVATVTDTIIAQAIAGDRYVSPAGNDYINNCVIAIQPCQTLRKGVQTVSVGNTVFVATGNYTDDNIYIGDEISLQGGLE